VPLDIVASRTLTKADLVERVYENIGFSKKEAAQIVESVFEVMKSALEHGDKVKISGFGNFVVQQKLPRRGRNPQTNQSLVIGARRVLTFKPSPVLKMALNESQVDR
jgi:integration host factor subunit alpha